MYYINVTNCFLQMEHTRTLNLISKYCHIIIALLHDIVSSKCHKTRFIFTLICFISCVINKTASRYIIDRADKLVNALNSVQKHDLLVLKGDGSGSISLPVDIVELTEQMTG